MALAAGTRLGPYEILAAIGVGGMGEVYRATDTNLGRDVAIKVLPDAVAQDAERLARFDREARTLAALNHPNIAAIYGLERSDGQVALVMELVEGPTLADRIVQGPIPVDEAMPIAKQIADALEAAHEQGIIHRDLKPANIKVRDDGTVKVLDFGLAKAMEPAGAASGSASVSMSPTITTPAMTEMGMILGTAAYMSPEQAKGRSADKRSDVWAFGAVLYEMLTGQHAFKGEDVSDTMASVLKADTDWDALPDSVPAAIVATLRRCLERDRSRRIRDIGDVRLALEGAFEAPAPTGVSMPLTTLPVWRRPLPVALGAALVGALVVGLAVRAWIGEPPAPAVQRFALTLPESDDLPRGSGDMLALSPDGHTLVYRALRNDTFQLFRRPKDAFEGTPIEGTEDGLSPFFSPDGLWVAFYSDGALRKVSLAGGQPQAITPLARGVRGGTWGPDGQIVVGVNRARGGSLLRVSAAGGEPVSLFATDDGRRAWYPQVMPGGEVLFTLSPTRTDGSELRLIVPETGEHRTVLPDASAGRLLETGHLVFVRRGSLWAVPFDRDRLESVGTPVPLVEGVRVEGGGAVQYAVADDGTLAYIPGDVAPGQSRSLLWAAAGSEEQPMSTPAGDYDSVVLSPDGRDAALEVEDDEGSGDVWVTELARGTLTRITSDSGYEGNPLWTRDGQHIVYVASRDGRVELLRKAADGTGEAETLVTFDEDVRDVTTGSWAPDGTTLAIMFSSRGRRRDIGVVSLDSPGTWSPLIQTPAAEHSPRISPDGRWIAYVSGDTGTDQVYVQRYPDLGGRRPVSVGTVDHHTPVWAPDGRALFYMRGGPPDAIMRASFETDPTTGGAVIGSAEVALDYVYWDRQGANRPYDISPDGDRFLVIASGVDAGTSAPHRQINIVLNWFEELQRSVPTD